MIEQYHVLCAVEATSSKSNITKAALVDSELKRHSTTASPPSPSQPSDVGHQTQSRRLRRHGGNGVLASDALPFAFDIHLVGERISQIIQGGTQPRFTLHGESPVPWIGIRTGIGSDFVTA